MVESRLGRLERNRFGRKHDASEHNTPTVDTTDRSCRANCRADVGTITSDRFGRPAGGVSRLQPPPPRTARGGRQVRESGRRGFNPAGSPRSPAGGFNRRSVYRGLPVGSSRRGPKIPSLRLGTTETQRVMIALCGCRDPFSRDGGAPIRAARVTISFAISVPRRVRSSGR